MLAFRGICFVGAAHFTPDGVRAQAMLAYVGTFSWALPILRLTAWGRNLSVA